MVKTVLTPGVAWPPCQTSLDYKHEHLFPGSIAVRSTRAAAGAVTPSWLPQTLAMARVNLPPSSFSFPVVLTLLGLSHFHVRFRGSLAILAKKDSWGCDRDCIGSDMGLQSHMILWEIWGKLESLSPVMS